MYVLLLFSGACLEIGLLLVKLIPLSFYRPERYAATAFLGVLASSWILLVGSWLFGFNVATYIVIILGLLAGLTQYFLNGKPDNHFERPRQSLLYATLTSFFSLIVTYLLYTHMLGPGPDGYYSASGSWGDLPLHLSIISNTAYERRFDWSFSLFAGAKLTYPFLIDFLSGMVMRWTGNLRLSLLVTSLPLCLCLIQLLFFSFLRLTRSVRAAAIGLCLFLLSGSSFGFLLLISDLRHQLTPHLSFLWHLPVDYSNTSIYGYGNIFNSILLPQRGFQLGLPAFCLIVILIVEALRSQRKEAFVMLIPASLLCSLLPLAHTHTFFVATGILILTVVYLLARQKILPLQALILLLPVLVLAAPQIIFQLSANGQIHFLKYHPAWMFSSETLSSIRFRPLAVVDYLTANFGLLIGLAALGYRMLAGPLQIAFWLGCTIFLLGNIFIFQPAEYDNIKFFVYGSFLLIPSAALLIARLSRTKTFLAALLLAVGTASGSAAVIYELPQRQLLYSFADLREAEALRQALPIEKLILTSDTHQHPLWSLAGQPVLRGYSYWLWSYGLPVDQLNVVVPLIYAGGSQASTLMDRYGIDYVYIGPSENQMYAVNQIFFTERYPTVFDQDGIIVYRIR